MTFSEWLALRRQSSAAEIASMRQLEAWEAGRRDLQSDLDPVLSLAKELAVALERTFAENSWAGVPEVLSEARALGLLRKPEDPPAARPVQTRTTRVVGTVVLG